MYEEELDFQLVIDAAKARTEACLGYKLVPKEDAIAELRSISDKLIANRVPADALDKLKAYVNSLAQ